MKKTKFIRFIALICLLNFLFYSAYAQRTIKVSNAKEFVAAIASNVIIELAYGLYDLNQYKQQDPMTGDIEGFVISNVSNLTIRGTGLFPSELIIDDDEYATVLVFKNCSNIQLENIEAGHGASKGQCMGAVIRVQESTDIIISKSILYGSGTYGIEAIDSEGITLEESTVRSCTYGAISLTNTSDVNFNDVSFTDNGVLDIFYINNCRAIGFNRCVIKDNRTDNQYTRLKLFNIEGGDSKVTLSNSLIKFNTVDYLCTKRSDLVLINTIIERNLYNKGTYGN